MIPLARTAVGDEEAAAVASVLRSGWLVQGPHVEGFESALAGATGARECVAVSSGTAALHVGFQAIGLSQNDAVFIPSFAWPSAANVATLIGAHVVFVDVRPDTYNIDVTDLEVKIQQCLTEGRHRPRLVVPVHQFGLMADMASVIEIAERYSLDIVADAACALGASRENLKLADSVKAAILSFHPRKSITTGEGGALITNDAAFAESCRVYRNHGQAYTDGKRSFVAAGTNYRLSDIAAAVGSVQLEKLPRILASRRGFAADYDGAFMQLPLLTRPPLAEHTFQTYMITAPKGEGPHWTAQLRERGIGAGPGSIAAHDQDFYRRTLGCSPSDFPVSHRLGCDGIALPLAHDLTELEVEAVIQGVAAVASS